jgi:hypothetical protein
MARLTVHRAARTIPSIESQDQPMAPRLEFLAYFVVLLIGVSVYLLERHASWAVFLGIVAAHLLGLRYLCRQMAKRFKFAEDETNKAA